MRLMGLEAIYPKPNLSKVSKKHKIYPYLLRCVSIDRADQVWSTDITYIRLKQGFIYLVAVIDWFSRYVLSYEFSTTLDKDFCIKALQDALKVTKPKIFVTTQVDRLKTVREKRILKPCLAQETDLACLA
ncbi:MAG: DDE-type integrase/transposase/recombinase [Deltaproteobacteria bacterium]|nr:DDE-type integrase/transposase/recombinase [Deltaproteobacteria bacterium]